MSAPQTNLEKQKRRHKGPLIGMAVGLIVGVLLMIYWGAAGSDDIATPPDAQDTTAPAVVQPGTAGGG